MRQVSAYDRQVDYDARIRRRREGRRRLLTRDIRARVSLLDVTLWAVGALWCVFTLVDLIAQLLRLL